MDIRAEWRVKEEADRRKWQNSSNEVSAELLLRVPPLDIIVWRFDVTGPQRAPKREITVLELPPRGGNPCSSNLMKLRELCVCVCVIKVACRARNESLPAETPKPGHKQTRRRIHEFSRGNYYGQIVSRLDLYIHKFDDLFRR